MEVVDFIKKIPTRIMIIWISCFDNARTIEEIAKIWGYSSGKVLQLGNVPSKMIKYKLLRVEKIEKRQMYFRSSFEVYPEIVKEFNKENLNEVNKTFYNDFLKDVDIWLRIIDSEEYKKTFLNIDLIKKICNNNRNFAGDYKNAIGIPLLGISVLNSVKIFEKLLQDNNFEKVKKNAINSFALIEQLIKPLISLKDYFEVIKKMDKETFNKLTIEVEKTELFKKYHEIVKILKPFFGSI
ncbi:MAG: hypothetical protein QXP04_01740 [Candidatus Nanoarchaeia archaeon]|nr:hypothetical protein [Candidatus Jingweiarchaeum tengchongense]